MCAICGKHFSGTYYRCEKCRARHSKDKRRHTSIDGHPVPKYNRRKSIPCAYCGKRNSCTADDALCEECRTRGITVEDIAKKIPPQRPWERKCIEKSWVGLDNIFG